MSMVGATLRKRREELRLDLRDISKITKIRYEFLKAIEDGAFENLPVEAYVKGYIREYAKVLDINPETAISEYIRQISPPEEEKAIQQRVQQRKRQKTRYLFIPFLIVLALAAILFSLLIFIPEKLETLFTYETKQEKTSAFLKIQKEPPSKVQEQVSLTLETGKKDLVKIEELRHTVEITATDTTWILATIDEITSKEVLLRPSESVTWDAKSSISLIIGNAGGVRLIFDGEEIGPFGEQGEVAKLNLPPPESKWGHTPQAE